MEQLPEQCKNSIAEIRLDSGARARMREKLSNYMHTHPLATPSPYQRFSNTLSPFTAWLRAPTFVAIFLLVAAGGVTTFASERALPGDPLYPLKVSLLEPARGAFAFTPQSKADWNVSLTEVRLREVEHLVEKGTFTPNESLQSRERFDRSVRTTRASIENLSKKNPDAAAKVNASFSASLNTHRKKLLGIGGTASTTADEDVRSFADHIEKESQNSVGSKDEEDDDSDDSSAETEGDGSRGSSTETGQNEPRGSSRESDD